MGAAEVHSRGIQAVAAEALERVSPAGEPFFVSFDLDVLDTPAAPGTSAHSPGGLTTFQAAAALRAAGRHPGCVGLDLVELAPALDPSGRSAEVAAVLVLEFLAGLAERARLQGRNRR